MLSLQNVLSKEHERLYWETDTLNKKNPLTRSQKTLICDLLTIHDYVLGVYLHTLKGYFCIFFERGHIQRRLGLIP